MNTQTPPQFIHASRRGVALVIVLSMLVLMSAVLVAFMGSVSSERAAQRAAYSGFEAQQAAESAVNLVISQIRSATQNDDGTVGWASQPGAIRTFGSGGNMVYKLYSSDNLQQTDSSYDPASVDESGYDPNQPKLTKPGFVDINQPILTPGTTPGSVEPHYPIVDPRAGLSREGRPAAPGKGKVEGFWTPQTNFHFSQKRDSNNNLIMETPMRVRWLYQLKDGSMVAADRSSGEIRGAEKDNPPVARVAFWTDDETSKLNLNTAGENTYWDTPMASLYNESGDAGSKVVTYTDPSRPSASLAASQPTQAEYQRYPGHPATTNLSPALRWLYPQATGSVVNDWQFKESLYRLLPRIRGGGGTSMAGTRANDDKDLGTVDNRLPKRDRLFSSLDEFWFRPDRSPISAPGLFTVFREESKTLVADPSKTSADYSPQALEQLRFFLTVNSRSPDLNMFGHPRVNIWPIHEIDDPVPTKSKRTGFDDLMAFTSSVSRMPYYFTRKDPWSPTHDLMKSGTIQVDPLPGAPERNRKLLFAINGGKEGYLQRMGKKSIPGVGASIAAKYSTPDPTGAYTEYERILLTIFDYIRSTNLVDTGRKDVTAPADTYRLAYTPGYSNNPDQKQRYERGSKSIPGSGQVIPSVVYDTGIPPNPVLKGFGRFVNLSEVGLLFYRDEGPDFAGVDDPMPDELKERIKDPNFKAGLSYVGLRCVLLPEMWTVSPGYTAYSEAYAFRVAETKAFKVSDPKNPLYKDKDLKIGELEAKNADFNLVNVNPWRLADGRFFMPTRAFNNQFCYDPDGASAALVPKIFKKPNNSPDANAYKNYPFFSKRFWIVAPPGQTMASTFTLHEGEFLFEFFPLAIQPGLNVGESHNPKPQSPANVGQVLQRVRVKFPEVTLPIPEHGVQNPAVANRFQERIKTARTDGDGTHLVKDGIDVIRTMEANGLAKGDLRHIAGLADVPSSYFNTSGSASDYSSNSKSIHNFRNSWGRVFPGAKYSLLTNGASRRGDKIAKVPMRNGNANFVDGTPADFDRGFSKHLDGPFINKPDEGNTRFKIPVEADGGHLPYFRGGNGYEEVGQTYFSPNRLISSPVMFGSLPSGIFSGRPWETLLFSPPLNNTHYGARTPADHYLLDFFHMPVVEPYAISEPLSTAGRVNLNSRLAPFGYVKVDRRSYIQRHTGLYGVFKGMKQFVIGPGPGAGAMVGDAGHPEGPLGNRTNRTRFDINPDLMMEEVIDPYLDSKKYFKYASEICELDLPLKDPALQGSNIGAGDRKTFWSKYHMTGDNARERPYAHIYPRLTTKSNVYTVHVWAQSIAKNPATKKDDWNKFDETKDRILGEYRGSTTLERYIDANDDALANYDPVENVNERGLDPFYRFRILNQKRFTPQ